MRNKILILGKTGFETFHIALKKALFYRRGTTVIIDGSSKKNKREEKFPKLRKFLLYQPDTFIHYGGKYYIDFSGISEDQREDFLLDLLERIKNENLYMKKNTTIVFDSWGWHYFNNKLNILWKLSNAPCRIIITGFRTDDILGVPIWKISRARQVDFEEKWKIRVLNPWG